MSTYDPRNQTPEQIAAATALEKAIGEVLKCRGWVEDDEYLVEWLVLGCTQRVEDPDSIGYMAIAPPGPAFPHRQEGLLREVLKADFGSAD